MGLLLVVAIYAALGIFLAVLHARPRWWLTRYLFSSWGPRTDTAFMTRRELFADALKFLILALLTFGALLLVGGMAALLGVSDMSGSWTPTTASVLTFMLGILTGVWVLGGLALLMHGVFRRRSYVPPAPAPRTRQRPYIG